MGGIPYLPKFDDANTVFGPYCAAGGLMLWTLCKGSGWPGRTTYLRCRPGGLNKTQSYKWGSWYLPMLLFGDGPLTPMNIVSLMVLAIVYDSLTTM